MSKGKVATLAVVLLAMPVVAVYEGTSLTTYQDPVGIPTVCMGETDRDLTIRERFTLAECQVVMGASLYKHASELDRCITRPVEPYEAAALLSIVYNVGVSALCKSTMVKQINAGEPGSVWCQQFDRWVYAKGIKLRGLVKRREAEKALCLGKG